MSRGGRHGYSVRVEKSYWLMACEDSHETDCDRKRKGSKVDGPPKKKMRTENVGNGGINAHNEVKAPVTEKKLPNISPSQPRTKCYECGNETDCNSYVSNELFDDIESVGSEYDGQNAFITDLFNGLESVSSVITNESGSETAGFSDILNIFDDFPSDDDEDRVIITEIFDDTEIAVPEKDVSCKPCRTLSNK